MFTSRYCWFIVIYTNIQIVSLENSNGTDYVLKTLIIHKIIKNSHWFSDLILLSFVRHTKKFIFWFSLAKKTNNKP